MKRVKLLFFSLFAVVFLFGCQDSSNDNASNGTVNPKTTFMVYMVGSNLESGALFASSNMREMLVGTQGDANTTIILQTGAAKHEMDNPVDHVFQQPPLVSDWTTIQLHKINNGTFTTLEQNMGLSCIENENIPNCTPMNKSNITDFIKKAAEYAPADRYVLVFWNHGGGSITGYGDSANSSTVTEIKDAIANSGVKFDIIGFDACLMSNLETAYSLKDYSKYFVGSEELESGYGWNYQDFLKVLAQNNALSSKDIAVSITDAFSSRYSSAQYSDPLYTLAAIDLSQIESVKNAFESYAETMTNNISDANTGLQAWVEFNNARNHTEYYGDYTAYYTLHVDLKDLVDESSNNNADINNAVQNAVISNKTERPNSYGLSVFMPYYYELLDAFAGVGHDFMGMYDTMYNNIMPNSVNFAKKLVETAQGGQDGNTTITETNTSVQNSGNTTTYSGNVNSSYGFRDINVITYYDNNQQSIFGTPFLENADVSNSTVTDFAYNITTRNGMLSFTNSDNTVSLEPYAIEADSQAQEYKFAFPVFYADNERLQCLQEAENQNITDNELIQQACNIGKYVMILTLDSSLNVTAVDADLKAYNNQNNKVAITLQEGDAVFLNSAEIDPVLGQFDVAFNKNNKFTIQNNITDTFKVSLKESDAANNIQFILYAINHAGGRKVITYPQGINAKMSVDYKSKADAILQAYTPRP